MPTTRGTALIRHADTGAVHEIEADELDWQQVGAEERGMGPEITYEADIEHSQLGRLTWRLWEYPIGVENDREVDVGPHVLVQNFQTGLEFEPDDDDLRQDRIDAMVGWFHDHFEDPAERTPYESREGGYQWIWGGPYDAQEQLADQFPNEAESLIEAAVEEIQSDGIVDWAPKERPGDYDDGALDEGTMLLDGGPLPDPDAEDPVSDLAAIFAAIPDQAPGPVFERDETGRIEFVGWNGVAESKGADALLGELRAVATDLVARLAGTNGHPDLLEALTRYRAALGADFGPASVSLIYARGVRLEAAIFVGDEEIRLGERPELPARAREDLTALLTLHGTWVVGQPDGRRLVDDAQRFARPPAGQAALVEAIDRLSAGIEGSPDLFGPIARREASAVAQDVGRGSHPERANQTAELTLSSLIGGLGRALRADARTVGLAVVADAFLASATGQSVLQLGAGFFNTAMTFLAAHAREFELFAAVTVENLAWLRRLLSWPLRWRAN